MASEVLPLSTADFTLHFDVSGKCSSLFSPSNCHWRQDSLRLQHHVHVYDDRCLAAFSICDMFGKEEAFTEYSDARPWAGFTDLLVSGIYH